MPKSGLIENYSEVLIHDLATPISSLHGVFDLMTERAIDAESKQILDHGRKALYQTSKIIDDSRVILGRKYQTGARVKEVFSPHEAVMDSIKSMAWQFQNAAIVVNPDADPEVKLRGNIYLFERVLANIFSNCIDALSGIRSRQRAIKIRYRLSSEKFVLEITDNGKGIKSSDLDKIFNVRFTTKKSGSHFGLGLSFVKDTLDKDFGASIRFESKLYSYTKCSITFPNVV